MFLKETFIKFSISQDWGGKSLLLSLEVNVFQCKTESKSKRKLCIVLCAYGMAFHLT